MATQYTDLIQQCASTYSLPFSLLEAQVITESSGHADAMRWEPSFYLNYIKDNPNAAAVAYGPFAACSVGLLQIMVEVAYEIGFTGRPEQLFDPKVGLAWGCNRMQHLWKAAGGTDPDYRVALAAYNGGPRMLTIPETAWPKPVQAYVTKVYGLAHA